MAALLNRTKMVAPRKSLFMLIFVLAAFCGNTLGYAQESAAETELVQVSLTSDRETLRPGESCRLRLLFTIAPGYHIYAPDPGEIGKPTQAGWQLPAGAVITEETWPVAQAAEQDGFKCNLYSGKAEVSAVLRIADTAPAGEQLLIEAHPSWLVCGQQCVPGRASVKIALSVTGDTFTGNTSADKVSGTQDVSQAKLPSHLPSELSGGLAAAVGLAFLGGIILNLMPCVFPVLSIKALELVQTSQADLSAQRRRAWAYSAGVIVSFWLAALLLNVLRGLGQQIGWGFQMQSPYFVISAAYVFVALAFNLLGFYEIGLSLTRLGDGGSQARSSFISGVLAVVVATPCTAPFMGAALGYALTVPWYENLLIFTALGCGLALPLLVLAFWPAWQRLLPRPGGWMVVLRQALAFPLLLTAVYFAWVADVQAGPYVSAAMLAGWVALGAAVWLYGRWGQYGARGICGLALGLALGGWLFGGYVYYAQIQRTISVGKETELGSTAKTETLGPWQPWTAQAAEQAAAAGRKIFIDFGASWCLTCQVNERAVLQQKRVLDAFAEHGVLLLKADWTNYDPEITKALERFGRSGVPLYVYYNGETPPVPQILPEVITADYLIELVGK
ncbi:MAG: thioredoxin family protein [bacterium]|nr:thioredoxin family protein [bacterium]